MNFNLSERYIYLINGLIGIAILWFLALSVGDAVRLRLANNVMPAASESATSHERGLTGLRPRVLYNAIVERDIFDFAPPPAPVAPVESEDLQVKLLGTSHLTTGKPYIIVEDNDGDESLYRQGDTIPNVGRVLEIGRERAIILHNGKRVALEIPHDSGEVPTVPMFGGRMRRRGFINNPMMRRLGRRVPIGALPPGIRRLSPNRYAIDRVTMDSNMQNPAKLFTEMRAVPNLQNGTSDGFKLSEIQPGSVFQQMGLRDGDVVTSVQGQSVNDPIRAMMLMQQLRNRSSISVSVMRNGTPLNLHYQIQ